MLPEEEARKKIDEQLKSAGWEVVTRCEYSRKNPSAVVEASMKARKESDYLLFIDNKAIAVVEAKRAENNLDESLLVKQKIIHLHRRAGMVFGLAKTKCHLCILQTAKRFCSKICLLKTAIMNKLIKCTLRKKCYV